MGRGMVLDETYNGLSSCAYGGEGQDGTRAQGQQQTKKEGRNNRRKNTTTEKRGRMRGKGTEKRGGRGTTTSGGRHLTTWTGMEEEKRKSVWVRGATPKISLEREGMTGIEGPSSRIYARKRDQKKEDALGSLKIEGGHLCQPPVRGEKG